MNKQQQDRWSKAIDEAFAPHLTRIATDMKTFDEIAATFTPYHTMAAFQVGAEDYRNRRYDNPYGTSSVDAQAWDRGMECAMQFTQQR